MGDPITTAIVVGAVTGGAMIEEGKQTRRLAGQEANRQKAEQDVQVKKLEDKQKADAEQEAARRLQQAQRQQKRLYSRGPSRSGGSILTTPLGLVGQANTAGRTALGE